MRKIESVKDPQACRPARRMGSGSLGDEVATEVEAIQSEMDDTSEEGEAMCVVWWIREPVDSEAGGGTVSTDRRIC